MTEKLLLPIIILFAFGLSACTDTEESKDNTAEGLMTEYIGTLEGITDKASAEAAVDNIKRILTALSNLSEKEEAIEPSKEKELEKKMQEQIERLQSIDDPNVMLTVMQAMGA